MSRATFFIQECPTCGRRLQVRVKYLGKLVECQHCRGRFEAYDPNGNHIPAHDSSEAVLARVDQLLASGDETKKPPR